MLGPSGGARVARADASTTALLPIGGCNLVSEFASGEQHDARSHDETERFSRGSARDEPA